jgi:hypothetical protein
MEVVQQRRLLRRLRAMAPVLIQARYRCVHDVIPVGGRQPWRNRNLPKRWRARSWSFFAASRARTKSRNASCAASGTHTAVKSPAR